MQEPSSLTSHLSTNSTTRTPDGQIVRRSTVAPRASIQSFRQIRQSAAPNPPLASNSAVTTDEFPPPSPQLPPAASDLSNHYQHLRNLLNDSDVRDSLTDLVVFDLDACQIRTSANLPPQSSVSSHGPTFLPVAPDGHPIPKFPAHDRKKLRRRLEDCSLFRPASQRSELECKQREMLDLAFFTAPLPDEIDDSGADFPTAVASMPPFVSLVDFDASDPSSNSNGIPTPNTVASGGGRSFLHDSDDDETFDSTNCSLLERTARLERLIVQSFFRCFVSIFKSYREFIRTPQQQAELQQQSATHAASQGLRSQDPLSKLQSHQGLSLSRELVTVYDVPALLKSVTSITGGDSNGSLAFLHSFVATQSFQRFIELRTTPGQESAPDVLYFDEAIIAKVCVCVLIQRCRSHLSHPQKNRSRLVRKKLPTPFLNDQRYITAQTYVVPDPDGEGLTQSS